MQMIADVTRQIGEFKRAIYENPALEVEDEIKRLRQSQFKKEYQMRQAGAGAGGGKAPGPASRSSSGGVDAVGAGVHGGGAAAGGTDFGAEQGMAMAGGLGTGDSGSGLTGGGGIGMGGGDAGLLMQQLGDMVGAASVQGGMQFGVPPPVMAYDPMLGAAAAAAVGAGAGLGLGGVLGPGSLLA